MLKTRPELSISRCFVLLFVIALSPTGNAQEHRTHPISDLPLHERFYSTWYMPDQPTRSCCNKADCYPTEVRVVGDIIYARRREDGKWLRIPPQKVKHKRDNPDGRNHLCAPPPAGISPPDTFFVSRLVQGLSSIYEYTGLIMGDRMVRPCGRNGIPRGLFQTLALRNR